MRRRTTAGACASVLFAALLVFGLTSSPAAIAEDSPQSQSESQSESQFKSQSKSQSKAQPSADKPALTVAARDESGAPVAGAGFELWQESNNKAGFQRGDDADLDMTCTTAEDGDCTVGTDADDPQLEKGTYYWIHTTSPKGYDEPKASDAPAGTAKIRNAGTDIDPTEVTLTQTPVPTPEDDSADGPKNGTPGDDADGSRDGVAGPRASHSMQPMAANRSWTLEKTASPEPAWHHTAATVEPGETITYTLTAENEHPFTVTGAQATDDLSDVLEHASLDLSSLDNELSWDAQAETLTWDVPTIPRCSRVWWCTPRTVSFDVIVDNDAPDGARLTNTAEPDSRGSCDDCTVRHEVSVPKPATITVHAGGVRAASSQVDPLPDGAVYEAQPRSGNPSGGAWECTIADGTCDITVPAGYSWEVGLKDAPAGWYNNPRLDTGDNPSPSSYVFRTRQLDDGDEIDVAGSRPNGGYRDSNRYGHEFSGLLAASRDNPEVPQQCGMNIALVLDQSGSMADDRRQANLKKAANNAIDSLIGTPSKMAIYTFASDTGGSRGLTSTATASSARPLHNFIDDLPSRPSGGTNWDRGLWQVVGDASKYDMVVFVTDGAPTYYGPGGNGDGNNTAFRYVEQGIFSANAIKDQGVSLVGLGIGIGNAENNLRAVTGPSQGDDYYLGSSGDFGAKLEDLASGACDGTLSISKKIKSWDGEVLANSPDADGWEFDGQIDGSGNSIDDFPATHERNDHHGHTNADVTIVPGSDPTITVSETLKDGYTLDDVTCQVDGENVRVRRSGSEVSFTGESGATMSCTFVNQEPRPAHTVTLEKEIGRAHV